MKRLGLVCLLILFPAPHARVCGQIEKLQDLNIEYGDLRDLNGRRVFVHCENLASRPRVLRELAKLPNLQVVGRKEDADFVLLFGAGLLQQGAPGGSDSLIYDNEVNSDSVDVVALVIINGPPQRVRVCWVTTRRRASLSTTQMVEVYPFSADPKAQLLKLLIKGFLASRPRLRSVPLNRPPEVNAARDFVKALRRAQGRADVKPPHASTNFLQHSRFDFSLTRTAVSHAGARRDAHGPPVGRASSR